MRLLLVGMNHTTAPVEVRERFAVNEVAPVLQKLADAEEIEEVAIISTCNRVEVVATTRQPEPARLLLADFFTDQGGALPEHLYRYRDREVVRHLFRVASAMDSMVVGEPQILGQLKDAYRDAVEATTCGPVLSRLFQHGFKVAKRVKNETRISERPVSVAKVAVDLTRQIFEQLEDKSALLIGAGEMIEAAMFALRREGLSRLRVANRTVAHAQELASSFGATAHGLDELDELLREADVILTCVASDDALLDAERITAALETRQNRPCFLIDLGVPRNVSPDVNEIDTVYLYDVDDLKDVAAANSEERMREARRGEQIVLEEEQRFDGWLVALEAVPAIRHLRARADAVVAQEFERFSGGLELTDAQFEKVDALVRAIVNKILHAPLSRLRADSEREEGLAMLEAARRLFALDDASAPGGHIDAELSAPEARQASEDEEEDGR
ncbi:MAG: glutamyl-tRNA reductase [Myxococcota bacterium]|nr:glutamyl-tRNA reductase [Myxococcota bacterium]